MTHLDEERPAIPHIQAVPAAPVTLPLPQTAILPYYEDLGQAVIIDADGSFSLPSQNYPNHPSLAIVPLLFGLLIPLASIVLQLSLVFYGSIPTVYILPKEQTITASTTFQQGRLVPSPTLTQSGVTRATGKGHQNATYAHGFITLFNGTFTPVTLPAGTIIQAANGVPTATGREAIVPAGNPPSYGQTTISAHATIAGTQGNISAYAINTPCCLPSVLAKNTTAFSGGADARDFTIVTANDIALLAATLEQRLLHPMQAALKAQLAERETLYTLPCRQTVQADHHTGEEATTFTVTVSATCQAIAYDTASLTHQAANRLSTIAADHLEAGYSDTGDTQTTITSVTIQNGRVSFSVKCQGIWVYRITTQTQQSIKSLIAGKTAAEVTRLLRTDSGIQAVSFDNLSESGRLPKDPTTIRLTILESAR